MPGRVLNRTIFFQRGLRPVMNELTRRAGFTKLDDAILDPESRGSLRAAAGFTKINATALDSGDIIRTLSEVRGNDGTILRLVTTGAKVYTVDADGTTAAIKTGLSSERHMGIAVLGNQALFVNAADTPFVSTIASTPVVSDAGVSRPDVSSVTATPGTGSNVRGTPVYYFAFVEGNTEGALSEGVEVTEALVGEQKVDLANVPLSATDGKTRIYRSFKHGGQGYFLAEVSGAGGGTTSYVDEIADKDLGDLPFLHGDPPRSQFEDILVHFDRVFALEGNTVWWSDLGETESWWTDSDLGNFAKVFDDDGDNGTALARAADGIYVFKENHLYKLVGRKPEDFVITEMTLSGRTRRSVGAPSPNAVTGIGESGIAFYWNGGIYILAGGEVSYISLEIEPELASIRRQDEALGVALGWYGSKRQLWVSVPLADGADPDTTYIWDASSQQWISKLSRGFRDFAELETEASVDEFWGISASDTGEGFVLQLDDGQTFAGTAISPVAELPPFTGGGPETLKEFLTVVPIFEPQASGSFDMEFIVDGKSTASRTVTVQQAEANVLRHDRPVQVGLKGREMVVRFKSSADQPRFKIMGLVLFWQEYPEAMYL